jgi:NAD(P)-dependent dehydrogenase (short-subunit alcohol dehydrogenase family)
MTKTAPVARPWLDDLTYLNRRVAIVTGDATGIGLGILVNHAGIHLFASALTITAAEFRRVLDVDLTGLRLCTRGA